MIALTLAEIADALGGRIVRGAADAVVSGSVETDSRLVGAGSVFVALPGETTYGALFAPAAVEAGAALVVAERELDGDGPLLVVDDGVAALAALARLVVARVRALGRLKVVAITGSNGKTTTKNLLRAVLDPEGPTVAPEGSFNNHVGAPISMLRVDESTEYLVVEMGASHVGEIARLVAIVTPDIGIVLKVGLAHAGEFGGIDAVQRAKAEMVTDLPADAVALLNGDDPRVAEMAGMTSARVVRFGLGDVNEVRADDLEATATGTTFDYVADGARHPVALRILGEHHVTNALAALGAARELGVPVERAIAAIEGVARAERWRMEVLERGDGVHGDQRRLQREPRLDRRGAQDVGAGDRARGSFDRRARRDGRAGGVRRRGARPHRAARGAAQHRATGRRGRTRPPHPCLGGAAGLVGRGVGVRRRSRRGIRFAAWRTPAR